jgi:hypothetical protein
MPTPRHGLAAVATVKNNQDNSGSRNVIYVIGEASKLGLDQISSSNEIFYQLNQP